MSSGPPWSVGDRVTFATGDSTDADTRELDGTDATVLDVRDELVQVDSIYGKVWYDEYGFLPAKERK